MTPKKEKALAALLTCPTKDTAAKQAGITGRTMSIYLQDPEFQAEYRKAFGNLVESATRQAQQIRVSAARSLLEYSLKLTGQTEILTRLDELEKSLSGGAL